LQGFHLTARAEIDIPADERGVSVLLPPAPDLRFPGPLVSLEKVTFKYPATKKGAVVPIVLQDIDMTIHFGDRVGVVGLNGCGKSTLIKLITDTTKATKGVVSRHPRLRLGYYSQHAVEELQAMGRTEAELTALALMTRDTAGEGEIEGELRGLLGSLGLPGRTASDVPLTKLSGGQLVRLALARLLWEHPQLLVLDEITTHLDYHTVTALADALSSWNGAILVVSHDRYLIRRVVEGQRDRDDEDDSESEDDEQLPVKRTVYLLKAGEMKVFGGGVQAFEDTLEKRVNKLMGD